MNLGEYQFVALEKGKSGPVRKSFMDAWKDMYQYVKELLGSDSLSLQTLETSIWIAMPGERFPMFFYDARDFAIDRYNWQIPA